MSLSELQNDSEDKSTSKKRSMERLLISKSNDDDILTDEPELEEDSKKQKSKGKKAKTKSRKGFHIWHTKTLNMFTWK